MTTTRIRWEDARTGTLGYIGTMTAPAFRIRWIVSDDRGWTLTTYLPLMIHGKRDRADDPDELKAEAERWLEEFVAALGATFPDAPYVDPDCEECGFGLPRHDKNCSHYPATPAPMAGEE